MIRDVLEASLRSALDKVGVDAPDAIVLERPGRREHGDWSSNVALATAKQAKANPRELAARIVDVISTDLPPHVTKVEIAGPGFVNFHLAPTWLQDVLTDVVTQGEADYGRRHTGAGERVMVEFVSANPTGPIHVGNGWFASYGDSLGRILERCGFGVTREYYVNDTGGQIRRLGESILARRAGSPLPEGGYPSGFVKGLASAYDGPDDIVEAGRWAAERILRFIQGQMDNVNIHFDEWFSQASIQESAYVAETIADLQDRGLVWEEDGALWLDTGRFGDPREKRVVRKSPDQGGDYTYLAGDIAYHRNKFLVRGYDRVINVWGADHQGQVSSLLAGVEALGVEKGRLEVRLGQMVSLAGGRIGKRLGNAVDLDDLVDDVGPDVMRLLSLVASLDQAPTVDLDKVRSESRESPVYYVQYAHARIHSIGKKADELGVTRADLASVDLSGLTHERELELLRTLDTLPEVIELAANERAPHKVTAWVRELADRFHGFYHDCRVLGDDVDPALTQARLWLVEASRIGFAIGLDLLGVAAPESM
ncbi:MAG TPA: arginine--tRNA ligase [Acidimicrobiales bacterium]|nr:arginine--tRNA ligase [Acidimicrobiales bacterium]